jgi:hypothetical protein
VTWPVKGKKRQMYFREEGSGGTSYAGLDDELLPNGAMITACYHVPPTKEGEPQNVGVRWEGPYIPNEDLPHSLCNKPDKRHLIVPSAASNSCSNQTQSSKQKADGSLNFQKLLIKKPLLSRFSPQSTAGCSPRDPVIENYF